MNVMKNFILLTQEIITQAQEMLGEIMSRLTNLSKANPVFEVSYDMKNRMSELGWDICLINKCNPSDIADEFHFDGLDAECYIGPEDEHLTVCLNLLCALAEAEGKDISWYTFVGEAWEEERDCYLCWDYDCFYREKALELDNLFS